MSNRFTYGMQPTEAIRQLNGLDDDVAVAKVAGTATAAAAAASASLAAGSATSAAAARDAANLAWQASTAPTEQLAAISKQFHAGAIVDAFLYDTSRDSDGGVWRKRCKHTSWENETLVPGKWLGVCAGFADAAAKGAVAGDYFQNTAGQFYQYVSLGSGGFEVYRGNMREFPAMALIVAESARLVIYDATQSSLPMWMVFLNGNTAYAIGTVTLVTAVGAANGQVIVCTATGGLHRLEFLKDASYRHHVDPTNTTLMRGLALRNNATNPRPMSGEAMLISAVTNDVATTVLPDAPVDFATGLPVPTIAVATGSGVSVIKQDGSVANITGQGGAAVGKIEFTPDGKIFTSYNYLNEAAIFDIPAASNTVATFLRRYYPTSSTADAGNLKALASGTDGLRFAGANRKNLYLGSSLGLTLIKECPASPAKGMAAYVTSLFNSGWQVGDSRVAWLADTIVETAVSSAELVTNGAFAADLSGWSVQVTGTSAITWNSGTAQIAPDGSNPATLSQGFATVIGRTYVVSFDVATNPVIPAIGTSLYGAQVYNQSGSAVPVGKQSFSFVAVSTTSYISFTRTAAVVVNLDNVSIKSGEADRGQKNKGLIVNGSITKAAVATGAQLVAYSGFSAANYLEQPYNSDLDFGTGDFCMMGWFKAGAQFCGLIDRNAARTSSTDAGFRIINTSGGDVLFKLGGVTLTATGYGAKSYFQHAVMYRKSGVLYAYINGTLIGSIAATGDVSNGAPLTVGGYWNAGALVADGSLAMALLRIGATPPSDDQIGQIYRDELALFQPNAKCTLDGTSASITALAYDDTADLLHAGTSWGRSAFRSLQRVESTATAVGSVTALAAGQGAHITGGASGARYAQPSLLLRDELRNREEARRAMAREEIPLDFDGIAGQLGFPIPSGFNVKGVFVAGTKKRAGSTKDYTISFDGYRQTVNFGVSPGATWVQIIVNRSI